MVRWQTYTSNNGRRYLVFKGTELFCPPGNPGDTMAVRMDATKPNPSFTIAWCATRSFGAY